MAVPTPNVRSLAFGEARGNEPHDVQQADSVRMGNTGNEQRVEEGMPEVLDLGLNGDWSVNSEPISDETIIAWENIKKIVTEVAPNLYISGFPDNDIIGKVRSLDIGLLISTTNTPPPRIGEARVIRLPMNDDFGKMPDLFKVEEAAALAFGYLNAHERVLVHCAYGLNRSSLVAAHILHLLYPDMSGQQIVELIQTKRPGALHNGLFAEIVRKLA